MTDDGNPENPYAAAIAALERDRAKIDATIDDLRKRSLMSDASAFPTVNGGGRGAPSSEKPYLGLVIPEAIRTYFGIARKRKKPSEIARALKEGGIQNESKNFYATVLTTLNRMQDVNRTADGWGLAEWGLPEQTPTKRKKRKRAKKSGRRAKRVGSQQPAAPTTARDRQIAESRKLQGQYMFWVGRVPAEKREAYKAIAKKDGREKAIKAMSRDFGD